MYGGFGGGEIFKSQGTLLKNIRDNSINLINNAMGRPSLLPEWAGPFFYSTISSRIEISKIVLTKLAPLNLSKIAYTFSYSSV